jgi:hypothetical protein
MSCNLLAVSVIAADKTHALLPALLHVDNQARIVPMACCAHSCNIASIDGAAELALHRSMLRLTSQSTVLANLHRGHVPQTS